MPFSVEKSPIDYNDLPVERAKFAERMEALVAEEAQAAPPLDPRVAANLEAVSAVNEENLV